MSNVAHLLERHLSPSQYDLLRRAAKVSAELGVGLLLVGGTVRDILSNKRPDDLDLVAVDGTPDFAVALAERVGAEVKARSQFGTAKLNAGQVGIDLAAARRESYAQPGALPTVSPGTIDYDLARRDFSINAMAISLGEATWGDLLDPFNGRRDLQRGLVRVLHERSFADDATRILRAVRYAQRMEYRIEAGTQRLLFRDLVHLDAISGDRIRHELQRFFSETRVADMLQAAQELGVLAAIHPALGLEPAVLDKLRAIRTKHTTENELRLLALLVFSVPAEELSPLISRLNMDGRWARVARDVASVRDSFQVLRDLEVRPSQVLGALHHLDPASIDGCSIATDDALVKRRLEDYLTELRYVRPLLNGDDLMALGVPEGPLVGRLLDKLLTARLDGLLSSREDEERYVVRSLGSGDL